MLYIVDGDLISSDATVIAHQTNCFKIMSLGIARAIKEIYPEAYQADVNFPHNSKERLGKCSAALTKDKKRFIVNLYGQYSFGNEKQRTDYDALRTALEQMLHSIPSLEAKGFPVKIGLPYKIGCNLAGGDWNEVKMILEETSQKYNRDIFLYRQEWQIQEEDIENIVNHLEITYEQLKKMIEERYGEKTALEENEFELIVKGKYEKVDFIESKHMLVYTKDKAIIIPFVENEKGEVSILTQEMREMETKDADIYDRTIEEFEKKLTALKIARDKHRAKEIVKKK